MIEVLTPNSAGRLSRKEITTRLATCPYLPSLSSINKALQGLLMAEQRYSAQISEIVRRDPSLTARLLRLVNSVYYGLTTPVNSIEEAVFYLGVRQIRQLTMVTPIIEDFQRLTRQCPFPWREFWQHCIGTAILTREVVSASQGTQDLIAIESEVFGMDHCELGALYLERHRLPDLMIKTARFHHEPEKADAHEAIIASVQIADLLMRNAQIGCSGNFVPVSREQYMAASGWSVLFPNAVDAEHAIARASLHRSLEHLPHVLEGLV